jgi:hypothetical protein
MGVDAPTGVRWGNDLTASLVRADRPSEVFQAAASCMAEEFTSDGFRWIKSRKSLERRDDAGRCERMILEPSYRNRAGQLIEFVVGQLRVDDALLGEWRFTNHPRTVVRGDSVLGTVCGTSCYDLKRVGFNNKVILTKPEGRVARLGALCEQIKEIVLPWFASTRDPKRLVQIVPEALLGPFAYATDLVEFLVVHNEPEQARLLIDRVMAIEPKQRAAFDEGRRLAQDGIRSRPRWLTPETLGWTSATLGLI